MLGRAWFTGCVPVVLALLALARARGRGASRAALVRRALRLTATQVLELYQIAPFVLQLDARAAPVTVRVGDGKQVSGVCSTSSRGVHVQAPPGALRGAPARPPERAFASQKTCRREKLLPRVGRPAPLTRESRVIRVRARSSRVGGVKGRRETRGARARRRELFRARAREGTHLSTLKSTSCRIFSQAPMPCFCTASRSACSSVASQYPRKAI